MSTLRLIAFICLALFLLFVSIGYLSSTSINATVVGLSAGVAGILIMILGIVEYKGQP